LLKGYLNERKKREIGWTRSECYEAIERVYADLAPQRSTYHRWLNVEIDPARHKFTIQIAPPFKW
jgi:hypothetical protein